MMKPEIIDQYFYGFKGLDKTNIYNKDEYTEEEKIKTHEIRQDLIRFLRIITDDPNWDVPYINSDRFFKFVICEPIYGIQYFDKFGYIAKVNADRNIVDVYYYGKTHDEAFMRAAYDIAWHYGHWYYSEYREEINKDFANRFEDGVYKEDIHHQGFGYAEHVIQLLRKYYGENIPEEMVLELENYVSDSEEMDLKYDYATNRFERAEDVKTLSRKKGVNNVQEKNRTNK